MTAFVRRTGSTREGSMFIVSGSTSTSTGPQSGERDDVGRGREGVRRDDHLVPRPEPERQNGHVQRGRSGRDRDGVLDAARLGEEALELGDLRPHRQVPAFEHLRDGLRLLAARVGPGEPDHVVAGCRSLYHAIVRARPSSSSTCASKPSSSRALPTFGKRTSTST